jgi:phosphopantetheine adenylyltransferase
MKFKKIRKLKRLTDTAYSCEVEIFNQKNQEWVKTPYVTSNDDDSELGKWILKQIATNNYKIEDQRVQ